jgi:hypothetical protein
MKATLEFNLPEEQYEHEYAVHGVDALLLISDLEGELRAMVNDDCGEFKESGILSFARRTEGDYLN